MLPEFPRASVFHTSTDLLSSPSALPSPKDFMHFCSSFQLKSSALIGEVPWAAC